VDRLKAELEANRDAVVQRKAMQVRYRLSWFSISPIGGVHIGARALLVI
jgi:hypothetical protein